jgi:hypothetical protein
VHDFADWVKNGSCECVVHLACNVDSLDAATEVLETFSTLYGDVVSAFDWYQGYNLVCQISTVSEENEGR